MKKKGRQKKKSFGISFKKHGEVFPKTRRLEFQTVLSQTPPIFLTNCKEMRGNS